MLSNHFLLNVNFLLRFYKYPDPVPRESFIQTLIPNPIKFSGYKLDVAIYAVITSVDPFRIYVLEGMII